MHLVFLRIRRLHSWRGCLSGEGREFIRTSSSSSTHREVRSYIGGGEEPRNRGYSISCLCSILQTSVYIINRSLHHRCIIVASSLHHRSIIVASSLHHRCIIVASSLHHNHTFNALFQMCLITWKLFEVLLTKPDEHVLHNLVLRNLLGRQRYTTSELPGCSGHSAIEGRTLSRECSLDCTNHVDDERLSNARHVTADVTADETADVTADETAYVTANETADLNCSSIDEDEITDRADDEIRRSNSKTSSREDCVQLTPSHEVADVNKTLDSRPHSGDTPLHVVNNSDEDLNTNNSAACRSNSTTVDENRHGIHQVINL